MNSRARAVLRADRGFALAGLAIVFCACGAARRLSDGAAYEDAPVLAAARQAHAAASISPEAERALGREAAANLVAKYGLVDDDALQRYANLVGLTLAVEAERKDLDWRFGILDSPLPNAYATPGGYIFITRGLVLLLRDESEFAAVVAHEIQHVDLKHSLDALRRTRTAEAGILLLDGDASIEAASHELIAQLERGHDHDDELEADRDGVRCAARAGYDPAGFLRALDRHRATGAADPFSLRHPPFAARIKALAALKGVPNAGANAAERFRIRTAALTRGAAVR